MTEKIKLAIVGSRHFNNYELLTEKIKEFRGVWGQDLEIEEIISGGATGADTLAKRYATEHQLTLIEYLPDWEQNGRAAGPIRNSQIVEHCTHLAAFPSKIGRGTQDSIKKAKASGKFVQIYWID